MRRSVLTLAAAAALVVAAPAAGDGGPPQNAVQGWDGATRGAFRYVAVPTPGWTSLQVIRRDGGRVLQWLNLEGRSRTSQPTHPAKRSCATTAQSCSATSRTE
jgi:hypothetical protein